MGYPDGMRNPTREQNNRWASEPCLSGRMKFSHRRPSSIGGEMNEDTATKVREEGTLELPPSDLMYRLLMERSAEIKSGDVKPSGRGAKAVDETRTEKEHVGMGILPRNL